MALRGCKKGELKARPRRSRQSLIAVRSSQYAVAVAVRKSQVTLLDAVASQTLALRGNEYLVLCTVTSGLYTKALLLRSEPTRLTPE